MTYNYPVWGGRDLFLKALNSLIEQNYENKEIVIIDDCSQDAIYEDCLSYAKKYSFIKLIKNEKNLGVIANLKKLLSQVGGDLFLWACPDDIYDLNFVSTCVESFRRNPHVVIASTAVKIFHQNGEVNIHHYLDFLRNLPFRKIVRNVFRGWDSCGKNVHNPPMIHSSLVKMDILLKNFHDSWLFIAEETWFLGMLIHGKIAYNDEILYFRYCASASHAEKDSQFSLEPSSNAKSFVHLIKCLRHFLFEKNLLFIQKARYLILFLYVLKYRLLKRVWNMFKCNLLLLLIKFGLMRYDSDETDASR